MDGLLETSMVSWICSVLNMLDILSGDINMEDEQDSGY